MSKNPTVHAPDIIASLPFQTYLGSYSALDRYFRVPRSAPIHLVVDSDLAGLARHFEMLSFPGEGFCDAATEIDGTTVLFTCADDGLPGTDSSFPVTDFLFELASERFLDIGDAYQQLRRRETHLRLPVEDAARTAAEAAILESRYAMATGLSTHAVRDILGSRPVGHVSEAEQSLILTEILTGTHPERGLRLLWKAGIVEAWWPELAAMADTDHSKEYHPEGGVWDHTLHPFEYRKDHDLALGLSLLLHDVGKPLSEGTRDRPFPEHSNLGAKAAAQFLRRLGYPESIVEKVTWLVRNHMIPGALHKLPTRRTASLMRAPHFPDLLELYRCDLSSTYRGPEGYYRACRVYKDFLKHERNPYRREDGRKVLRIQQGLA